MAKRPFTFSSEEFKLQRLDIADEGLLDFFKDIGRAIGISFDDIHSQLDEIKEHINKNGKTIKNEQPFSKIKNISTFGRYENLDGLVKDSSNLLKDLSGMNIGTIYKDIMKLGSQLDNKNRDAMIEKLLSFTLKELKSGIKSSCLNYLYDLAGYFIKHQFSIQNLEWFFIPVQFVTCKSNNDYFIQFSINYSKNPMAWLYIGPADVSYRNLLSTDDIAENKYRKKLAGYKLTDFSKVETLIKALDENKDNYRKMYNDCIKNIHEVKDVNKKYRGNSNDNRLNDNFTKILSKAYQDRLQFFYRIQMDYIKVIKYALDM